MQSASKTIKNIIWVTQAGSQHMTWSEEGSPDGFTVCSWHDLVEKNRRSTNSEVLPLDKDSQVPPVSIFCPTSNGGFDLVKYTSEVNAEPLIFPCTLRNTDLCLQNLISGTAALQATLARAYKLSPTDTVLPTTLLTDSYTLCWTFAALYSNATLYLNSVSGEKVDLVSTASQANPTVVIASPATVQGYLSHPSTTLPSGISKYLSTRTLQAGTLPSKPSSSSSSDPLSHLRVLLVPQSSSSANSTDAASARLSSATLHTLRTHFTARVGYAMTSSAVAGAIAQTNILDYRDKGGKVCVGAPLSSVEVNLVGEEDIMATRTPKGTVRLSSFLIIALFFSNGNTDITVRIADHNQRARGGRWQNDSRFQYPGAD